MKTLYPRIVPIYLLGVFSLLPLLLTSCFEQEPQYVNTYQGNLDALWRIIDERYCYLDYKNIDWKAVKVDYDARLSKVKNELELFDLMASMLAELKDGHVNLISDFDVSRYHDWYLKYPANFNAGIIFGADSKYLGPTYRRAGGLRYGTLYDGTVGYIYYGDFTVAFTDANMSRIFDAFRNCTSLIIDVRNNGGGAILYAEQLASYFFPEERLTGYLRHKTGRGHSDFSDYIRVKTKAHSFLHWDKGPVALLCNRMSYSATNDFINRMSTLDNVITVGDTSGGGGGIPLSSELPNGWSLRFSASPMYDIDKRDTEFGIEPDFKQDMNPADEKNDAIIERAIIELEKKRRGF